MKRVTPPSDKTSPKEVHSTVINTSKNATKDGSTVNLSEKTIDSKQSNKLSDISHSTENNNQPSDDLQKTYTDDSNPELASNNLTAKEPKGSGMSNTTCDQSLFREISAAENTQPQFESLSDELPKMSCHQDEPSSNSEQEKRVRFKEKSPDIVAVDDSSQETKENREPLRTVNVSMHNASLLTEVYCWEHVGNVNRPL